MPAAAIFDFQKFEILTFWITVPNVIKIVLTVAETCRFYGFPNGNRTLSWILEIQFF